MPSNITTDKHAPYKTAIEELKNEGIIEQNLNHRTLKGIEAMAMMIKEQIIYLSKDYQNQIQFFNRLFNVYD